MKKRISLALIFLVILTMTGCIKGGSGMFNLFGNKPGQVPEAGGVEDYSNPSAVKEIESDKLQEFRLRCENSMGVSVPSKDGSSAPMTYPAGYYTFEMFKKDDGASVTADFAGEVFKFDVDEEELTNLAKFLKDPNVASMNGHSQRNSALGTHIDLEAVYESGEKISIYAEGGASVIPNNWDERVYVEYFDGLVEKYTGQSYGASLIEDNSDPDAVKNFTSDTISEIYVEFDTSARPSERGGFDYGKYRFQVRKGGLPYVGIETNGAVWKDAYVVTSFDMTDEDIAAFQSWLEEKNYLSLNGWDKKSTTDSYTKLELHVYYENGESLMIDARGDSAMPPGWNSAEMLQFIEDFAESHGTTIKSDN